MARVRPSGGMAMAFAPEAATAIGRPIGRGRAGSDTFQKVTEFALSGDSTRAAMVLPSGEKATDAPVAAVARLARRWGSRSPRTGPPGSAFLPTGKSW